MEWTHGVHHGICDEDYHSIEALSSSTLGRFAKTPATALVSTATTDAMRFGTLAHSLILEPSTFDLKHLVAPTGVNWREKKADTQAGMLRAQAKAKDLILIKGEDMEILQKMAGSVMKNAAAMELFDLDGRQTEVTAMWEMEGVKCKARIDLIANGARTMVDLKTAKDASPGKIAKLMRWEGYARQLAWYQMGLREAGGPSLDKVVLCAVEKTAPFNSGFYDVIPFLPLGQQQHQELFTRWVAQVALNQWPNSYTPGGVMTLEND